jgi:hypothetical protein
VGYDCRRVVSSSQLLSGGLLPPLRLKHRFSTESLPRFQSALIHIRCGNRDETSPRLQQSSFAGDGSNATRMHLASAMGMKCGIPVKKMGTAPTNAARRALWEASYLQTPPLPASTLYKITKRCRERYSAVLVLPQVFS